VRAETSFFPWVDHSHYGPGLNFCYRPLLFEEVNVERYGYTRGMLQPAISVARFYGNAVALPYSLLTQRPNRSVYHDHLSRPGAPAPRERRLPHQ